MDPIKLINNTFHLDIGAWTPAQSHARNGNAGAQTWNRTSPPHPHKAATSPAASGSHAAPRDTVELSHHQDEPVYTRRHLREGLEARRANGGGAKVTSAARSGEPSATGASAPRARQVMRQGGGSPSFRLKSLLQKGSEALASTVQRASTWCEAVITPASSHPAPRPVNAPRAANAPQSSPANAAPAATASRPASSVTQRVLGATQRVLGGAGVVLSALQVKSGLEQLQRGDTANGAANVGGGTANGASSVLALTGRMSGAMKAGGAGAIIDGVNDLYQGHKSGQTYRALEGGAKTAVGVAMLSGTAAAGPAAVGYAAYTGTQAGLSVKVWGDKTGNDFLSSRMDERINPSENAAYARQSDQNRNYRDSSAYVHGASAEHLKASGDDRHAVTRAILGEQQQVEDCHAVGDSAGAAAAAAQLQRLRDEQARVNAVYGEHQGTYY